MLFSAGQWRKNQLRLPTTFPAWLSYRLWLCGLCYSSSNSILNCKRKTHLYRRRHASWRKLWTPMLSSLAVHRDWHQGNHYWSTVFPIIISSSRLKRKKLIVATIGISTPACWSNTKHHSVSTIDYRFQSLLQEFVVVTVPTPKTNNRHDVQHYIETTGSPISNRPLRFSGDKLLKKITFCSNRAFRVL